MSETSTEIQNEVTPSNPFATDSWKTVEPVSSIEPTSHDPVIADKDQKIFDEKPTSDKPNEPEKIPGATPVPIQERVRDVIKEEKPIEKAEPTPVVEPEPIKFANEESEKVFNLLKEGKVKEVNAILNEQNKLAEADKLTPAEQIKLNLQYQNKEYTPQEISEMFDDIYTMPDKPKQLLTEDDDEFKERTDKYDAQVKRIEARITRDAKPAMAELLKLQKDIVLPDIQRQSVANNEPTQEELAAQQKHTEQFLQSVDQSLKELNGYKVSYKDEEVEMQIPYMLSKEQKAEIQPLIALSNSNAGEFLSKIGWIDDKGNINAKKLAEDLPFILNKENILQKMVTETGNQRLAEAKRSIKNIDYSGTRSNGGDLGQNGKQLEGNMVKHFFGA